MAFIPVDNCLQLTLHWRSNEGVEAVNRFYIIYAVPPTSTDAETACQDFSDYFSEGFSDTITNNWSLNSIVARDMSEEEGFEVVFTGDLPKPGTSVGLPTPYQVSATITWVTGFVGRAARGRTYIVGLPYSYVEDFSNRLSDAGRAALETVWTGLLTVYSGSRNLNVVSFFDAGVPRTAGRPLPIVGGRCNFPLATQRRRLR